MTSNGQLVKFPVERAFVNDETIELKPNEKPPGIDVKSKLLLFIDFEIFRNLLFY